METGWYIWNPKNKVLFISLVVSLALSCRESSNRHKTNTIPNLDTLENATLVCRVGNGYFSNFFRTYASAEKKYSHIGIISEEDGLLYVYHSEASELTGAGQVKKETLDVFLTDITVYDFFEFNYPDSTKKKIMTHIKHYYANEIPFDLAFDNANDDALYCTELVAKAVNKAMDSQEIEPTLLLNGKKLYGLDDIYLNEHVKKITFEMVD